MEVEEWKGNGNDPKERPILLYYLFYQPTNLKHARAGLMLEGEKIIELHKLRGLFSKDDQAVCCTINQEIQCSFPKLFRKVNKINSRRYHWLNLQILSVDPWNSKEMVAWQPV